MNLKLILMAAGAFVIGLGGSTAAIVMRTPARTAAVAAADSLGTRHANALAQARTGGAGDSAHATAAATPLAVPAAPTHTLSPDAAPAASPHPVGPDATPATAAPPPSVRALPSPPLPSNSLTAAEGPAGYRQVARVLSSMKPADAAKIVAYLSDDQLEGIFGQLGVRQAASLMSQLPTERAAAMSRRIMKHTEAQ